MKFMRSIFIAFGLFFIISPLSAYASGSLSISEIMYDASGADSGHEWVEAYNSGSTTITLVGGSGSGSWRFNDGSNHFLAQTPAMGTLSIPAGGYVIFADDAPTFLADHASFSGTLIDTTINLPNTGGTVKIIDGDGNVVDSISYTNALGASGDGNTLQLSGASWISAVSTPGAQTVGGSSTSSSSTTTSQTQTSTIATSPVPTKSLNTAIAYETPHMQANVSAPISATTGLPIKISATVYGMAKEYRQAGIFHFALGDGTEMETRTPPVFEHTYMYPGQYVLLFEYRTTAYMTEPEVTYRQVIEVSAPSVIISAIKSDGAIEIKNTADADADISNWWIEHGTARARMPKGTVILSGKSVVMNMGASAETSNTLLASAEPARILLPSGAVVSEYGMPLTSAPISNVVTVASTAYVPPQTSVAKVSGSSQVLASATPLMLSANAVDSIPNTEIPKSSKKSIGIFIIGLVGIITASFLALRRASIQKPADGGDIHLSSQTAELADSIRIIEEE
jgi:hypothetical protein